jgi:hypothetical protein
MAKDSLEDARKEVEQEYRQFREQFGKVLEAAQQVSNADAFADIHGLMEKLEDIVKKVRTGGLVGSGAKGHREALEHYTKLMTAQNNAPVDK